MRKLLVFVVAAVALSGCHAQGSLRVRGPNPFAVLSTAVRVAAVVATVAVAPPVVTTVEYYDYGARPGHVWVNGRHTYVNNQWVWSAGYWQPEQTGHYWVQGAWTQQGNGYVWVDGHWAQPRQGYVYLDGYWDYRDTGYVWMPGRWEADRPGHVYVGGSWTMHSGRRTWSHGRWEHDDGRVEYARFRTRGRVHASGGAVIRDHR